MASALDGLEGYHPIISCEGTAEQVIVGKLVAAAALEYRRLSSIPKGEACLADLVR
jgi:hypothetical protein